MSSQDEVEEARRRLKEEAERVRKEVEEQRKAKMKNLVGAAPEVGQRKEQVKLDQKRYADMGLQRNTNKELDTTSLAEAEAIRLRKLKLEEDQRNISVKGKTYLTEAEIKSPATLAKEKFEKGAKVPTLFNSDPFVYEGGKSGGASSAPAKTANAAKAPADLTPKGWDGKTFYSLRDLRQRLVENVDKHNREQYLSPEDFQEAFGMTKAEFALLPKWKRDKLKSSLHLF